MERTHNICLLIGASLSAIAASLHLACIVFGAPLYRFLGAGERMAHLASSGNCYPTVAALVVAAVLCIWSLYALSGAGVIRKLPWVRVALTLITGIYLLRGVAFAPLMKYYPDNSQLFWFVSSAICVAFGVVHFIGLRQAWAKL
jgi:hypothetical protein